MTLTAPGVHALAVAECFGPTWQGEGPSLGRLASFVRLGGCNLHCNFCDTPYTWDARRYDLRTEIGYRDVPGILADVATHGTALTVVTGGEPLLHQDRPGWVPLLDGLTTDGREVEVETNGTQTPNPGTTARVTRFNVSPKLAHAGDPAPARIRPDVLTALNTTGKATFKFVCRTPDDLTEVDTIVEDAGIEPHRVWVMPEGTTPAALAAHTAALADPVLACGWNFTTRLHVLCWGDERGR